MAEIPKSCPPVKARTELESALLEAEASLRQTIALWFTELLVAIASHVLVRTYHWRRAPELPPYVFDALPYANRREIARKTAVPYRDWSSVAWAGGRVRALAGTIGQPDAGTLSVGVYTLHGGFWLPAGLQGEHRHTLPLILRWHLGPVTARGICSLPVSFCQVLRYIK